MRSRLSGSLSARASTASKLHPPAMSIVCSQARLRRTATAREYGTGTVRVPYLPRAGWPPPRVLGVRPEGRRAAPGSARVRAEPRRAKGTVPYCTGTVPARAGRCRGFLGVRWKRQGVGPVSELASPSTRVAPGRITRISRAFDGSSRPELCYVRTPFEESWEQMEALSGDGAPLLPRSDGSVLPPSAVVEALARVLASGAFRASARRKRLLGYLVEETAAGRADRLKPYAIAVDALGCDETFDPQADPIVRLEVGRLRRGPEHYYPTAGRDDPVRITVPKGGSVPAFERRGPAPEAAPELAASPDAARPPPARRRRRALGAVLLALTLGLAGGFRLLTRGGDDHARGPARASEPAVLVLPLEAAGDEDSRLLASGLTGELIATLMRFGALQVFAGAPPEQGGAALPPAAAGASAYVVAGRVGREPGRVRVTARLTDRASGQVLWSGSYDRALTTSDIFDLEAELAASIAGRLAQPYGVIPEAAAKGLGEGRPESVSAYDCVQRALAYRLTFARELYAPVRSCLEQAVR